MAMPAVDLTTFYSCQLNAIPQNKRSTNHANPAQTLKKP